VPDFSDFIVFVDESGDHGMASIDPHYPIFTLAFCLFAKEEYARRVAPAVLDFKFRHFGHDQVILHEHEIRKTKGAFRFLTDADRREPFFADLNALIACTPFTLVASVIDKRLYKERYPGAANPYHVAMGFGLERIFLHLRGLGCRTGVAHLLFERRGEKEDRALEEEEFRRVCGGHNAMAAAAVRGRDGGQAVQLGRPAAGGPRGAAHRAPGAGPGAAQPRLRHPGGQVPPQPARADRGMGPEGVSLNSERPRL
jgi:hypothetical protein